MADDSISTSEAFAARLHDGAKKGLPIDVVLKGMGQSEVNSYLFLQYDLIEDQYNKLVEQYNTVLHDVKKGNKELIGRIEHILSLMSANMAFIKQLVALIDTSTARLDEQEKINTRQELSLASFVDKQNQLSQCLTNMNANSVAIVKTIDEIKTKLNEHDKFNSKIAILLSIGALLVTWLMTGNNFSQLLVFLNQIIERAS